MDFCFTVFENVYPGVNRVKGVLREKYINLPFPQKKKKKNCRPQYVIKFLFSFFS